ncbi:Chlorovirus glycoprotein repeat domain-containing protein, partial [Operophtera brumata]
MTEFCIFNRQLSETRTRVELIASSWQDAAVYVNNNFVVDDFMRSDESFEEMVMMAHVCLTRTACETLVGVDNRRLMDPTLQAARHARQMQDTPHATELYLQTLVGVDNRRLMDPTLQAARHARQMQDTPHATELYLQATGLSRDIASPRLWEHELGDWWDNTPLLPGMNRYYDAADLLLRLRAITLAEACVSQALVEEGESAAYYHLVALCCRLRGDIEGALCHIQTGIAKYGEYYHLVALCCRLRGDIEGALCHIQTGIAKYGEYYHLVALCCLRGDIEGALCHIQTGIAKYGEVSIVLPPGGSVLPPARGHLGGAVPHSDWHREYYHLVALCCRLRGDIEGAQCHIQMGIAKYGEVSIVLPPGGSVLPPARGHRGGAVPHSDRHREVRRALCCRLRGDIEGALCHIQTGIEKFGEISYLKSLEAECYHKQHNIAAATTSFEKAGSSVGAY